MRIFCPAMVAAVSFSRCRYVRERWLSHARRTVDPAMSDPRGRACRACCRYAAFIKQLDHGDLECRTGQKHTRTPGEGGWLPQRQPATPRGRNLTSMPD